MCEKGILTGDKLLICKQCSGTLKYAAKTKKVPIHALAHYDLGKKPSGLVRLNLGEKLAISKSIVYVPLIQFKPVYGPGNAGVKGHSFGIKSSQEEIERSIMKILPRHDLAEVIQISLCAEKEMNHIAKEIIKRGPLDIRIEAIMPWLHWFKALENPYSVF